MHLEDFPTVIDTTRDPVRDIQQAQLQEDAQDTCPEYGPAAQLQPLKSHNSLSFMSVCRITFGSETNTNTLVCGMTRYICP